MSFGATRAPTSTTAPSAATISTSTRRLRPRRVLLRLGNFGDFDIDEIMDNSSGYLNAILFLGYLFVAVFIMLSMFCCMS